MKLKDNIIIKRLLLLIQSFCLLYFLNMKFLYSSSGISLFENVIVSTCVLLALYIFLERIELFQSDHMKEISGNSLYLNGFWIKAFSLFMAAVYVADCEYIDVENQFAVVWRDQFPLLYYFLFLAGGVVFFENIVTLFYIWLKENRLKQVDPVRNCNRSGSFCRIRQNIVGFLYGRRTMLHSALVILVCWLPILYYRYPGAVSVDVWFGYAQYLGIVPLTNKHGTFFVFLYGWLLKHFSDLFPLETAVFFLILIQVIFHIIAFSYTILLLKKADIPNRIITLILALFCLSPIFFTCATILIKDSMFCAGFLILIDELIFLFFYRKKIRHMWIHAIMISVSVLTMHFRGNGKYIVWLFLFMTLIHTGKLVLKKKEKVLTVFLLVISILIPYLGGNAWVHYLETKHDVEKISGRVILASPLQQIARSVIDHPQDMREDDWKTLQNVFDLDEKTIKQKFDPSTFDPLKWYYKNDASTKDKINFLKLWAKRFIKHPDDCLSAVLEQNYYMLDFFIDNISFRRATVMKIKGSLEVDLKLFEQYTPDEHVTERQKLIQQYASGLKKVPFIGWMIQEGSYTFLLLAFLIFCLYCRQWKYILICLPLLATWAITFLGPMCIHQARYLYPLYYSLPVILVCFRHGNRS